STHLSCFMCRQVRYSAFSLHVLPFPLFLLLSPRLPSSPLFPYTTLFRSVCGITPYDSTHLGHAFTYVAFDTLNRVWRDAGVAVTYVQNVTDVDDPLLERAEQTGVDWRELAADQVQLFRTDMQALRVLPPEHYVGVVEVIDLVVAAVERVLAAGGAYWVEQDVYADLSADPRFGSVSNLDRAEMARLSAER